jgi:hypothetical protein
MTVTPPRRTTKNIWTDNATALDYEIAQEKAATLGRLGRGLEAALGALREFDTQPREAGERKQERRTLVAEAGHALWMFVVQREALGLRDSRQLMRDYGVPPEVQGRMGMLPEKSRR